MSKIRSREDETYSILTNCDYVNTDMILYEIAMSLGRIADMLTEANGYIVEYDSENEGRMADYYQDEESEDEE